MKRFYKTVAASRVAEGFHILLDGKPVQTPARHRLTLPTQKLADAIAEEWRVQGDTIVPASMPMLRMANTVLDGISQNRDEVIGAILRFGEHDLLSYPAEAPAELMARQKSVWTPLLEWADLRHGARLAVASGITHVEQPPATLTALRAAIAAQDDYALASLHVMASITGSLVLALALSEEQIHPAQAFQMSRLDEEFQAEKWGQDAEAEIRARGLARELDVAAAFLATSRA